MPRKKMLYIEFKTDQNDRGPAWIGLAALSGSGRTIYFNTIRLLPSKKQMLPGFMKWKMSNEKCVTNVL